MLAMDMHDSLLTEHSSFIGSCENPDDSSLNSTNELSIYVRPEIRKGCAWDINLKFSAQILNKEKMEQIYIEKPRGVAGRTMPYLCMKVRSKMIKPVLELPFTKVGVIIQESDLVECNETGTAILRVKFTSRPRAVFHKHSDVMILLVSLKRGNETICSSAKELIFRGGTGSIHSAEGRNGGLAKKRKFEPVLSPEPTEPVWPPVTMNYPKELITEPLKPEPLTEQKIETSINPISWPSDDFIDFGNPPTLYTETIDTYPTENYLFDTPEDSGASPQYTVVFGKRRGSCKVCLSECSFYRGPGGPCNECGCFPSQHIDLDKKP